LLTSKDAKADLVEALDSGADDYLTKPFNISELKARLAVGRRILTLQNELLRKEQELSFQAQHDSLTGLWNRGAIMTFMEREIARSRRCGSQIGVLMLDIDHFKQINDTYGHTTGDKVLVDVGQRLTSGIRTYDWVGRYGGEEFLVLLSDCNTETVKLCAERIREIVADEPVTASGKPLKVTVSVGAALCPNEDSTTCQEFLQLADKALYRAKQNGRNRVELAW
jgi:diguanylate cyclase (GGDEF)-like protein